MRDSPPVAAHRKAYRAAAAAAAVVVGDPVGAMHVVGWRCRPRCGHFRRRRRQPVTTAVRLGPRPARLKPSIPTSQIGRLASSAGRSTLCRKANSPRWPRNSQRFMTSIPVVGAAVGIGRSELPVGAELHGARWPQVDHVAARRGGIDLVGEVGHPGPQHGARLHLPAGGQAQQVLGAVPHGVGGVGVALADMTPVHRQQGLPGGRQAGHPVGRVDGCVASARDGGAARSRRRCRTAHRCRWHGPPAARPAPRASAG